MKTTPSPTILVCDDSSLNRMLIAAFLRATPLTLVEAEDGHSGLALFRATPDRFDLILLDIHLPDLSGFDICRQIRKIAEQSQTAVPPIIAYTADALEGKDSFISAGFDNFLLKPIDAGTFYKVLRHYFPQVPLPG